MKAQVELTGRHVLLIGMAFFAAVIAVNAAFIMLAVRSYPGEQERRSYRQGLQYNAVLQERAAQAALGWRASIEDLAREGGSVRIVISLVRDNRTPIDGLDLSGALMRPVSREGRQTLAFAPLGGGRYEAIVAAAPGAWDISVSAVSDVGARFQFANRVIVE